MHRRRQGKGRRQQIAQVVDFLGASGAGIKSNEQVARERRRKRERFTVILHRVQESRGCGLSGFVRGSIVLVKPSGEAHAKERAKGWSRILICRPNPDTFN